MRAVSAFLILCCLTPPACAAEPVAAPVRWESAGWDGGGCYPNVEFDPVVRDRVYLASDVAGLWRSDDGGENWRFITRGLGNLIVPVVAVAPSDTGVLYAGTSAGVFVSADAGENWRAAAGADRLTFKRPDSHRSLLVSPRDAARVAAGTSSGDVFLSRDSGAAWTLLGDKRPFHRGGPITALAWADGEKTLYASSSAGLARFSFERSRWESLPGSPKGITDFSVSAAQPAVIRAAGQKQLFSSSDGGRSWKKGAEIPKGVLYRLAAPAGDGPLLAAWNDGWKGGVLRSEDGGESWQEWGGKMEADAVSDPTRAWAGVHGRINSLKPDPFEPDVWLRTDWWGVWRSRDGGRTWEEKIKGAPNTVATDIAISDEGEVYVAAMDNGLLKSSDGGKSYKPLFPAKGYSDDLNGHVWRVRLAGGKVYATSSPWVADLNQLAVSADKGGRFERFRKGLPARRPRKNTVWERGYARALAVHPQTPETVFLGIDGDDGGGFYRSHDGGRSFRRPASQPGSLQIYNGLDVDPERPGTLLWGASGAGGGLYLSEDSGESWRPVGPRLPYIFDVVFAAGGVAYAAGEDTGPVLYASRDHGRTWRLWKRFEAGKSAKGLCVLPDGRVAVGVMNWHGNAPGHLYLGSADGKTWTNIDGDLPEGEGAAALAYHPVEKALYLARFAGSVYKTRLETQP